MQIDVKSLQCGSQLYAELKGELDHHSIQEIRATLDIELRRLQPALLVLDFGGVSFMDSSGIGFVMGRHRLMQELDGKVVVCNFSSDIEKVMRLSGLNRLVMMKQGEQLQARN